MLSLAKTDRTVESEKPPNTKLEGDLVGQLVASLIAQNLADLYAMRDDVAARCPHVANLPESLRNTVEYEARLIVNRQNKVLHQGAIFKAAERLAQDTHGPCPLTSLPVHVRNRYFQLARLAVAAYVAVLDGSHAPLTLREYAAGSVLASEVQS